jgi:CDP-glycerol glycerophosphotransferase (TagB/SpsB family)
MFGNVVASGVRTAEELDLWLKEWNALPNTAIDSEGDIAPLFAAADVFVTDGISFLGEYPLATGKPAIFFENDTHWPWSPIGKIAARANIHVQTFQEFEDVFNDIAEHGLPDFSHEIAALQSAAQPYPGQAAEKIVDVILNDFKAKTPLVNKALVTEVAWENKPGSEPAWD